MFLASKEVRIDPVPPVLVDRSASLHQLQEAIQTMGGASNRLYIAAIFAWFFAGALLLFPALSNSARFFPPSPSKLSNPKLIAALSIIIFVATTILSTIFVYFVQELGTLAIFNNFIIFLVLAVTATTYLSRKTSVPIITGLVLFAFIFSGNGINNNHLIQFTTLPQPKRVWDAGGPQRSFQSWLASRSDLSHFQDMKKPYPIFVIAARGGGIYATAQTAIFLARMQDRCPNFSQHVFAISSVSGGSIGAAAFVALVRNHVLNQQWQPCVFGAQDQGVLESRVQDFIRRDFLSPLLSAALFPDLLQRVLPFPIQSFDRAKALEASLEYAWAAVDPGASNPFKELFLDQWDPTMAAPALLVNTSEVERGRQMIISPFVISPSREKELTWFYDKPGIPLFYRDRNTEPSDAYLVKADIKLSTAAVMSARFPWLLPSAGIAQTSKLNVVDGGYFDNSGIETALDLIEDLTTLRSFDKNLSDFAIHLIILSGQDSDDSSGQTSELFTPVETLLSTRVSRGNLTELRAGTMRFFYNAGTSGGPPLAYSLIVPATLDHQDFKSWPWVPIFASSRTYHQCTNIYSKMNAAI
jgi:hypothetical protein